MPVPNLTHLIPNFSQTLKYPNQYPTVAGLFDSLNTQSLFLTTCSFAHSSSGWSTLLVQAIGSSGWTLWRVEVLGSSSSTVEDGVGWGRGGGEGEVIITDNVDPVMICLHKFSICIQPLGWQMAYLPLMVHI